MDNKIIWKFPIEELNVIFGGVRERTVYGFEAVINKTEEPDEAKVLIKDSMFRYADNEVITRQFLKIFAASFGITRRDDALALINYMKVIKDAKRYFRNVEIDIESVYENHEDIYDFIDYFNDNPVIKQEADKVNRAAEKNGSILEFSISEEEGFHCLLRAETPKEFERTDIMIFMSSNVFDVVETEENGSVHRYPYPFIALKEKNFKEILYARGTRLIKTVLFEAEVEDENPEFRKYLISKKYSFSRDYDILRRAIINCQL